MKEEKTYQPEENEDLRSFVNRVIAEQPDREPLRIIEQLAEITMSELKDRPYQFSATASVKGMTLTLRHSGRPINERIVWVMGDHTDHVDYHPDGDNGWILTIHRDIPPFFATRR
jgi:hypothetical protein